MDTPLVVDVIGVFGAVVLIYLVGTQLFGWGK